MEKVHDEGPFYHRTKVELKIGDYLRAGFVSNYDSRVTMNHIYFTPLKDGAVFAAQIAAGKAEVPHVYLVEPTGPYENDPNVTDKKFSGNPTRSYRSTTPLKVIAEVTDWTRQPQDKIDILRKKLPHLRQTVKQPLLIKPPYIRLYFKHVSSGKKTTILVK